MFSIIVSTLCPSPQWIKAEIVLKLIKAERIGVQFQGYCPMRLYHKKTGMEAIG
ncbi:hypothetical protein [Rossellomorea sp. DUT-2]|uniref:hypothetical protein n=1 Tax=Rossellomorea sp. DUT-2 TaxID=3412021 RepID=UPI003D16A079